MVICLPYCLCMWTFGFKSLRMSVCVVAAITALWWLRASFCRLLNTIYSSYILLYPSSETKKE
jgi:hypothetical protein